MWRVARKGWKRSSKGRAKRSLDNPSALIFASFAAPPTAAGQHEDAGKAEQREGSRLRDNIDTGDAKVTVQIGLIGLVAEGDLVVCDIAGARQARHSIHLERSNASERIHQKRVGMKSV